MSEVLEHFQDDSLPSYHLSLRGNSINPIVDAATPLLGMVMRLKHITDQAMPENY